MRIPRKPPKRCHWRCRSASPLASARRCLRQGIRRAQAASRWPLRKVEETAHRRQRGAYKSPEPRVPTYAACGPMGEPVCPDDEIEGRGRTRRGHNGICRPHKRRTGVRLGRAAATVQGWRDTCRKAGGPGKRLPRQTRPPHSPSPRCRRASAAASGGTSAAATGGTSVARIPCSGRASARDHRAAPGRGLPKLPAPITSIERSDSAVGR